MAAQISSRRSSSMIWSMRSEDISDNVGRWKTIVCRWHDPGGIQGDGKHSHLERRHHRALRARRRSPNRKSINIRAGFYKRGCQEKTLLPFRMEMEKVGSIKGDVKRK